MFSAIQAWLLNRRAQQEMCAGKLQDAVGTLTELLKLRPKDSLLWVKRAVCYRELQNFQAGYDDAIASIKLKDDDASVWEFAGQMLRELDQPVKAIKALDRALQIEPQRSSVRLERGMALIALGHNRDALEDLDKFVKRTPTSIDGFYCRALARFNLYEMPEALQDIDQCLGLAPKVKAALLMRAQILGSLDRAAESATAFEAVMAAGKPLEDIIGSYAYQLVEAGRYQDALPLLERGSKLYPGRGWFLSRAKCYKAMGDSARAESERRAAARYLRETVESLRKTGTIRNGVVLQANHNMFKPGEKDYTGLVLLTFDDDWNAETDRLQQLARQIMDFKGRSDIKDPALRAAANIVSNDLTVDNRRQLIPLELTDGKRIYAADITFYRDFLPDGYITSETRVLPVIAEPGDTGRMEMLPWPGSRAHG